MSNLDQIVSTCLKDPALKAKLIADPTAFLAERGIQIPPRLTVKVLENTPTLFHIVLPSAAADSGVLSDEELASAAGGGEVWTQTNGITGTTVER